MIGMNYMYKQRYVHIVTYEFNNLLMNLSNAKTFYSIKNH